MIRPCSSTHQPFGSNTQPAGAGLLASCRFSKSRRYTPRGPGSSRHSPHLSAPVPEVAEGSPSAAMNWIGDRRWNFGLSATPRDELGT